LVVVTPSLVTLSVTPPLEPIATPLALAVDPPLLEEEDDELDAANAKLPPFATTTLVDDADPARALPPATIERARAVMMILFTETSNVSCSLGLSRHEDSTR
jgi:hypothetical protein